MLKEAGQTFMALLIIGLMAAAVAIGWKWGQKEHWI